MFALSQGDETNYNYSEENTTIDTPDTPISQTEPNERTHLIQGIKPSSKQLFDWKQLYDWAKTHFKLNVFPVAVVLAWCAVPLPYNDPYNINPDKNISIEKSLLGSPNDTDSHQIPVETSDPVEINFWFFLFFYYGFYNAIALLMITKIFDLYSLNWWPKWLGGLSAYFAFWLSSLFIGVLIYLFTGLEKYTLTWVLLTFITMNMPLLAAFIVIRSENRNVYRHSRTIHQKTFLEYQLESHIPTSYVRFLWFCITLLLVIAAFIAGEAYAYIFISSPETHSGIDAFIYVYSWLATIYILDTVTEYIIETRIRSDKSSYHPLQFVFKLYFYMIYFIFYRNLFARLRDREQYILIQAASSLWVCIFYPLCMTRRVHKFLVNYLGLQKDYTDYQKQCGRSFFIRNLAENATMLGFICWIVIIHCGPNNRAYPYFNFKEDDAFDFERTLRASSVIWAFELASSAITRTVYHRVFKLDISREAEKDFVQYPNMVITMIVIIIHVLQDMLLALLSLNFEGGHSKKRVP